MSFEFATDWMDASTGLGSTPAPLSPLVPPRATAPAHPTPPELARLVEELFAEGSLSIEQLRALGTIPELGPLLDSTLAGAATSRRALKVR